MYKFKINLIPANFKSFLNRNDQIHAHQTRSACKYHLVNPKTSLAQKSIKHRGPDIWNSLPNDIIQCTSLNSFKSSLKKYLMSFYN